MRYREHRPHPLLVPYVACYWTIDGTVPTPGTRLVVPDACLDLVFRMAGAAGSSTALAVGTMTEPLPVQQEGAQDLLGVRFRPGAGGPFLELPADELTDRLVPLPDLWGPAGLSLPERLAEAGTRGEAAGGTHPSGPSPAGPGGRSATALARIRTLDRLLLERLGAAGPEVDPLVMDGLALLGRVRDGVTVSKLARRTGLGRRQLGRRFRAAVGIPPSTAARVLRFQAALQGLHEHPDRPLTRIAFDAGYHDQPHLTREFRALAGEPPGAYRIRRRLSAPAEP